MRPGCALTDTSIEVFRQDPRAFTRTAFYQEWIRHLGLRHVLGGTLADTAGSHLNFTFLRSARTGAYREQEVAAFRRLSRHVAKSVELSGQIEAHRWAHEFADLLLRGRTVKEAAEKLDMTFETARWYCKQVMHKIGVNRQSRLIATLLSNVLVSVDTDVR